MCISLVIELIGSSYSQMVKASYKRHKGIKIQ